MKIKTILTGICFGLFTAVVLAAGTEAAQAVTESETALSETLHAIVNFLPWPWNVVGGAVLTAGAAFFAWRKGKTSKKS